MPLSEALYLLLFDSTIAALIVPFHEAYVFTVMQIFADHYPLAVAAAISSFGVLIGMSCNWTIGKLATSITKTTVNAEEETKLNPRLTSKKNIIEHIKNTWRKHGHWLLLCVGFIPFLAQALVLLAGWTGIPLKRIIIPILLGTFLYYGSVLVG